MARNTDVNAYFYVGIPKQAAAYQRLVQDAQDKGVTVAKLIAMRIDDFYKYGSQPLTPVATHEELTRQQQAPSAVNLPIDERDQEDANAEAALDAWG